ncbi:MAG: glycoside hydrolase 100 family protein [Gilvibacter sp.]
MIAQPLYNDALTLLNKLSTTHGFLASSIAADNYKRIWARDAMVCGVASVLVGRKELLDSFKQSLLTLAKYSHTNGMIPSNVDPHTGDVSFGSLVGRIDANTWFVIGACLHYLHTKDEQTWATLKPKAEKTLLYLKALEQNDRGWLYTPLSGNWADEYPIHGYTLYDNGLYHWAQRLWAKCNDSEVNEAIEAKTQSNFWPTAGAAKNMVYQEVAFQKAAKQGVDHFSAFILPGIYDTRFDAAANGLALLLWPLSKEQKQGVARTIDSFKNDLGTALVPAFWPIVDKDSPDWYLLENNYSYDFKNTPGAFHNGGIWPVWMGLFCLGLASQGMYEEAQKIATAFSTYVSEDANWQFQEYLHANELTFQGKTQMGYTASGIVFMAAAIEQKSIAELLHF